MPANGTLPMRADARGGDATSAPDLPTLLADLADSSSKLDEMHESAFRIIGRRLTKPSRGDLVHAGKLSGALLLAQQHIDKAITHASQLGGAG